MMIRKLFFAATVVFIFGSLASSQSVLKPRVSGLERDSIYMSLLKQEQTLKRGEDSISRIITAKRVDFTADTTNRAVKGNEIIRLEGELFYIKNSIGIVASKTNAIEQEFLIKNIRTDSELSDSRKNFNVTTNYPNLVTNSYFRENLPAEEFAMIMRDNKIYKNYVDVFLKTYDQLDEISALYQDATTPAKADSIYAQFRLNLQKLRSVEDSLATHWNRDFNDQIYVYSYLLDKLNMSDKLAQLHQIGREMPQPPADVQSESFAKYPGEASLLLAYQTEVAKILGLNKAVDSLNRELQNIDTLNLSLPKIVLERREFVRYQDITIVLPPVYNAKKPIPDIDLPQTGTYYTVLLGNYSSPPPAIAAFKGVTPLFKERQKNSQIRYFAGLFASASEALEAVERLKTENFKRPEPAVWRNGIYRNLAAEAEQNQGLFRVEITGGNIENNDDVKYAISKYAKRQELTRVDGSYSIGVFANKLPANELCDALVAIGGFAVKVVEVDANAK